MAELIKFPGANKGNVDPRQTLANELLARKTKLLRESRNRVFAQDPPFLLKGRLPDGTTVEYVARHLETVSQEISGGSRTGVLDVYLSIDGSFKVVEYSPHNDHTPGQLHTATALELAGDPVLANRLLYDMEVLGSGIDVQQARADYLDEETNLTTVYQSRL